MAGVALTCQVEFIFIIINHTNWQELREWWGAEEWEAVTTRNNRTKDKDIIAVAQTSERHSTRVGS